MSVFLVKTSPRNIRLSLFTSSETLDLFKDPILDGGPERDREEERDFIHLRVVSCLIPICMRRGVESCFRNNPRMGLYISCNSNPFTEKRVYSSDRR